MGRKLDRVRQSATFGGHPAEDTELEYVVSPFFPELCLVGYSNSEQKETQVAWAQQVHVKKRPLQQNTGQQGHAKKRHCSRGNSTAPRDYFTEPHPWRR